MQMKINKHAVSKEAELETAIRDAYPKVYSYLYHRTLDAALSKDLTQETFVRFFAKLSEYRHVGKAKNYLYTIAANLCKNAFAKRAPLTAEEETLEALGERAADVENAATTHLLLEWALGELPPEQREVVILHYYQDLKQREIAEILEIGLPLVKYRLRQAKLRLSELIGKEETP